MVIFDQIVALADQQNKNILVIGSPRSGTHAVGSELADRAKAKYFGEICITDGRDRFLEDINKIYDVDNKSVSQIVRLAPKLYLAPNLNIIKQHAIVVSVCRKDKVKQFASWMYFKNLDYDQEVKWHNHKETDTKIAPNSIQVQEQDLEQFMLEQMLDFYFLPEFNLCYEDLTFTQHRFEKNKFTYPLENIFLNLDKVKQTLAHWEYSIDHFKQR